MEILRLASFADGENGGNPAGVVIADELPAAQVMQEAAARVGFSETVFAAPLDRSWRVRFFSPETEVPFCGHATIALGAALALRHGNGRFSLTLNEADIEVEGNHSAEGLSAALQSPPTHNRNASYRQVETALQLFGYTRDDLSSTIPPAIIHGGIDHLLLPLRSRQALSSMKYDLGTGRDLMLQEGWVTIMLVFAEAPQLFHARNPFAYGGVYEDPATGSASAAFAGYLRDKALSNVPTIEIVQGEDMGERSLIRADIPHGAGTPIRVSGKVRHMA